MAVPRTDGDLRRVVDHVFLPPKLPQKADNDTEVALTTITLEALVALRNLLPGSPPDAIEKCIALVTNIKACNGLRGGLIDEQLLHKTLETLPVGCTLAVKVSSQNAAVLVTRRQDELVFEAFELSAENAAVIATKGRLVRTFPGLAIAVPATLLDQVDFSTTIANTLTTMCHKKAPEMQPKSHRIGVEHDETRDSAHPAIVSELFMGVLRGIGKPTLVSSITKNTRDEVLWDRAELPWRRSPMWLLIRVALELVIDRSADGSPTLYKEITVFLMSHILEAGLHLSADLVFTMTAKIQRRLQKLPATGTPVISKLIMASIHHTLKRAAASLEERWNLSQQLDSRDIQLPTLETLDLEQDTKVQLPELGDYIKSMRTRRCDRAPVRFVPSSHFNKLDPAALPTLPGSTEPMHAKYAAANLNEFEHWVGRYLEQWVAITQERDPCEKLQALVSRYHFHAANCYVGNPEATSMMVLTIFELWVALDTAAILICPWLSEYNPGIAVDVLQNLLLPSLDQMQRLHRVEKYLDNRCRNGRPTVNLFALKGSDSFAIRYFEQSDLHKVLLLRIESDAHAAREAKKAEFRRVKAEYQRLDALYNCRDHQFITETVYPSHAPPETTQSHAKNCQKCAHGSQRDSLSIQCHEWPLSIDSSEAKAVVFELIVPSWFGSWRDSRFYLLDEVLKGKRTKVRNPGGGRIYVLSQRDDPHLTQHFQQVGAHRITLMSLVKPTLNTHYRGKDIASVNEDSEICVPNGLRYQYYDTTSETFLEDFSFEDHDMPLACTYAMSSQLLHGYLFRPASAPDGPAPNSVIASQEACPNNMSLEEYKELVSIPLGRHIQWANILLQLATPGVDFKKTETTKVILQCIYQSGPPGPPSAVLRDSHDFFRSDGKAISLMEHLTDALQRVRENWESSQALYVFVAIACRTLSLSGSSRVQETCLEFLATARGIAQGWVLNLKDKAYAAVDHADRTAFIAKGVEMALICTATYDVDDQYLQEILDKENNASVLVQASIVVQEGEHSWPDKPEQHLLTLELRRKRLLHRAYNVLAQHHAELDNAMAKTWSAYVPASQGWCAGLGAANHWVATDTSATPEASSAVVHYDLLSGELLVNGLPLNQPPQEYRHHSVYSALFGKAVVEVMPSTVPGFQFSTKRDFGGWAVQMGMSSAGDLIVSAMRDGSTFETIPSRLVKDGYPEFFVKESMHWYEAETGTVQFRPIREPWDSFSPAVWTLSQLQPTSQWQLRRSDSIVVGIGSPTSIQVSHVLSPLALQTRIHPILQVSGDTKDLHVSIPTLRLGFTLPQGSQLLESKDFRSMRVDGDQTTGCLVGLQNKLVLRHATGNDRMVLIPESETVTCSPYHGHVEVNVSTAAPNSVSRVHALQIDTALGRLLDNNDLGCKLYLAYLHALTSFCLVDPLTQKTGTEQALTILRSAAVRSFDQLSQGDICSLEKIAGLSPGRCYYPVGLRVMQTVSWKGDLGFLSQHGHFVTEVNSLLRQAEQAQIFFPLAQLKIPCLHKTDDHLLQRDNIRSATFRVANFGAEDHTVLYDQEYKARDRDPLSQRATRASAMSCCLFRDGDGLTETAPAVGRLWQKIAALDTVHGRREALETLSYDPSLFNEGHDSVLSKLPALHRWLGNSSTSHEHKFSIMMWLSTMAFGPDSDVPMLETVAMLFKSTKLVQLLRRLDTLQTGKFIPKRGKICAKDDLRDLVLRCHVHPFRQCSEAKLPRQGNEGDDALHRRRLLAWGSARDQAVSAFVDGLASQWPCKTPQTPPDVTSAYIVVNGAMKATRKHFKKWHDNKLLDEYLASLQKAVSRLTVQKVRFDHVPPSTPQVSRRVPGYISEHRVFSLPAPEMPEDCRTNISSIQSSPQQQKSGKSPILRSVIKTLGKLAGQSTHELKYTAHLSESLDALQTQVDDQQPSVDVAADTLSSHLGSCKEHVNKLYDALVTALNPVPNLNVDRIMCQRPRVSPAFFLQQLSRTRWKRLPESWKSCILGYGLALTALQRAERLVKLSSKQEDLLSELRNTGHQNWDPREYPESLLMEVESGILIREVQAQIASQMQDPPNGDNAVMQLNMGEGKSSVIVPIVAAALADGNSLVRVIVAKPQSKQMAQMLISKLGGLLDRRVYYMPISRSLKLDQVAALTIFKTLRDCVSTGGILLIQPEHILSFQLMAPECYATDREAVGQELMSIQDFLEQNTRDIVDESDENFSVRFELIYTLGSQRPIELSPDRWLVLQQVFDLVRMIAPGVSRELPGSLEYLPGSGSGSFPRLRILRSDAGALLLQRLADHVCDHGLNGFQISRQPEAIRKALYVYLTKTQLNAAEIKAVEDTLFWTETTSPPLLLLRGLIACGVLQFVLGQKRWRVNYGLASRTPATRLAVPYRAKDSPSPRSEFSHPDVVTALTCLSYYYGGLSDEDLFIAMGHLVESDQSDIEYQNWVQDADNIPTAFKQLQGINLKDRPACTSKVFPALRLAKSAVDYFLSHIVFSKEMKEFPFKLSASGWDIGKSKRLPVTGFSGTNDSRCLLPTSVEQIDHPEQKHTNALVLEYILQPENGVELMKPVTQDMSDADHVLTTVLNLEPPVQVLLDVGAQILELNNLEVAKAWLKRHETTKEAVVFVNDEDELCIVDRDGRVDLLRSSSFSSRLDSCLIFLDEAHTRGIDLRLPPHYRAAVTLGAGLTKDRLVQCCMRMRNLGKGQTVVFCVSQEIQDKIMERTTKVSSSDISLEDVIVWSICETHTDTRRSMPLWAVQGERFVRQEKLWQQIRHDGHTSMTKAQAEKFQEDEAQTLDGRFRPGQFQRQPAHFADVSDPAIERIVKRCEQFDDLQFHSSALQEEQERELSPEAEQERQVQRAPPADPALHRLHQHVRNFATTGVYVVDSEAFMPAFEALKDSSATKGFSVGQLIINTKLLVTVDFARTVKESHSDSYASDAFQRHVQWILTNRIKGTNIVDQMIIISPYEANKLYKIMETSRASTMHVFKPRCNSGYASLDGLDFHTISGQAVPPKVPRELAVQLGLFAGQLYISSFEDYQEICKFLGLSAKALTKKMGEQGWKVAADGFILSDYLGRVGGVSGLRQSPVNFFKILMSKIRRNGDGISKTHMGDLLDGKLFQVSDFEE